MLRITIAFIALVCITLQCRADKIYILAGSGYNTIDQPIITAMMNNGHTVVTSTNLTIPNGFTTTCVDAVNGYDWLCFFGNINYAGYLPQISSFINAGGKVFYQYEVSCCDVSSTSVASILSGLTGLNITPNANSYIAGSSTSNQIAWSGNSADCCVNFAGNAYKGLDGVPLPNQFRATANVNGSVPLVSVCPNFGFVFTTTDFAGTTHKGAIVGLGDVNIWYRSGEPPNNGGTMPVDTALVNYFFPANTSGCFLLPPGCITTAPVLNTLHVSLGNDTTICQGQALQLNAAVNGAASYLWQDNSTAATLNVTQPGTYWVRVANACSTAYDTIQVNVTPAPSINLGADTTYCGLFTRVLTAGNAGAVWSTGVTGAQITVSTPGVYWAAISSCGNLVSDTVAITQGGSSAFTLGPDTAICPGQSVHLVSPLAGGYNWSNGDTTAAITTGTGGPVWLRLNQNGCISADTLVITVSPAPQATITAAPTAICANDSAAICAATGFSQYTWNTGATGNCITAYFAGNYYVTVTDANNCSAESNHVAISVFPLQPISVTVQGDTLTVHNVTTCQWYLNSQPIAGATDPVLVANQQGSYSVSITDSNGCTVASNPIFITGLNSVAQQDQLQVYPNPSAGGWNFIATENLAGVPFEIFDGRGRLVYQDKIATRFFTVDINAEPGIYWLKLNIKQAVSVYKLVKL